MGGGWMFAKGVVVVSSLVLMKFVDIFAHFSGIEGCGGGAMASTEEEGHSDGWRTEHPGEAADALDTSSSTSSTAASSTMISGMRHVDQATYEVFGFHDDELHVSGSLSQAQGQQEQQQQHHAQLQGETQAAPRSPPDNHHSHPQQHTPQRSGTSSTSSTTAMVGTVLVNLDRGAFRLERAIGAGAFGRVHFGHLLCNGEPMEAVAIKELHAMADDQRARRTFEQEARLLAECSHINIARLFGVCYHDASYYLVMEYAFGGPLNRVLRRHQLEPPVIVDWATQIARGMNYLHNERSTASVIHRDLKSSNILLAKVDENGAPLRRNNVLKIADFGLARHFSETTEMTTAGTFAWMAPEVIRSSTFSRGSDVWSFGVLLWELLTSQVPYEGINMYSVAYSIGLKGCTLPVPSTCPPDIARILTRCWPLSPRERPPFDELLLELQALQTSAFSRTDATNFFDLQAAWREECSRKFRELRRTEKEIEEQQYELQTLQEQQRLKQKELEDKEQALVRREREVEIHEKFYKSFAHMPPPSKDPTSPPGRRRPRHITKDHISEPLSFRQLQSFGGEPPKTISLQEANAKFGNTRSPPQPSSPPYDAQDAKRVVLDCIFSSAAPPAPEQRSAAPPSSQGRRSSSSSSTASRKAASEPRNTTSISRTRKDSKRRIPFSTRLFGRRSTIGGEHPKISPPNIAVHLSSGAVEAGQQFPSWLKLSLSPDEAERDLRDAPIGAFNVSRKPHDSNSRLLLTVKQGQTDLFQETIYIFSDGFQLGENARIRHRSLKELIRHYQTFPYVKMDGQFHRLRASPPPPAHTPSSESGAATGEATRQRGLPAGNQRSGSSTDLITFSEHLNRPRSVSESQLLLLEETCGVADTGGPSRMERSTSMDSLLDALPCATSTGAATPTPSGCHQPTHGPTSGGRAGNDRSRPHAGGTPHMRLSVSADNANDANDYCHHRQPHRQQQQQQQHGSSARIQPQRAAPPPPSSSTGAATRRASNTRQHVPPHEGSRRRAATTSATMGTDSVRRVTSGSSLVAEETPTIVHVPTPPPRARVSNHQATACPDRRHHGQRHPELRPVVSAMAELGTASPEVPNIFDNSTNSTHHQRHGQGDTLAWSSESAQPLSRHNPFRPLVLSESTQSDPSGRPQPPDSDV